MRYLCSAGTLAQYVVDKCYSEDRPVSNLQLQKILYFLQIVYCRAKDGQELLFPDEFQAWPYGPVLPDVYWEYSEYGGRVIKKRFNVMPPCPPDVMSFLNEGIEVLSKKSPWDLVRTSHAKGSPWEQVYKDGCGYKQTIPNELLIAAACEGN